jgi:hypothetical protein
MLTPRPLNLPFACAALLVAAGVAFACKYSVRDVAFVDISPEPYFAYIHVDSSVSPATRAEIESARRAVFLDANVTSEVVDIDVDPDHSSTRDAHGSLPRIVLEAPDGRTMSLPIGTGATPSTDDIWAAVEAVTTSRVRRQVRRRMFDAHTVIIVVEGTSSTANDQAARIAADATSRVREGMDELPKPIAKPPYTVVIPADRGQEEAVLLWSLGLDSRRSDDAHVVALFGRMRVLGDPLTVPGATEGALFTMLDLVGQDCECTLDRSWMQGTMVPHYWDSQDETLAMEALGFDPGNPLVMTEVSRIVNRPTALTDPPGGSGGSFGYSETVIAATGADADGASAARSALPVVAVADGPGAGRVDAVGDPAKRLPLAATAAAIVALALGGGAFVFARSRRGV